MFCWPIYYESNLKDIPTIQRINKVKTNVDKAKKMNSKTLMTINDYLEQFSGVEVSENYLNLSEKYLLAEAARVTFFVLQKILKI